MSRCVRRPRYSRASGCVYGVVAEGNLHVRKASMRIVLSRIYDHRKHLGDGVVKVLDATVFFRVIRASLGFHGAENLWIT